MANAVVDGSDCLMLSAETASGLYPVESVATMGRIITEAERIVDYSAAFREVRREGTLRLPCSNTNCH